MTPILQALAQGYSEEQVLSYLAKLFPKFSKKISQASSQGYSAQQILKYLNQSDQKGRSTQGLSPHEIESINQERVNKSGKKILSTAATALGGAAIANKIPSLIQKGVSAIGPSVMGGAPVQPSTTNALKSSIETQPVPIQPEESPEATARQGMNQKLDRMTPEFREWAKRQIEEGKEKPLDQMLSEFESMNPSHKKQTPLMKGIAEDVKRMQKGSLVTSPSGVTGTIHDIKNKEALIQEDGKLHKVKADELIESPIPEKDIAELHDDLVKGIQKATGQEVSRNVQWAGYSPEDNLLAYIPHDGGLYIYDDIAPEDVEQLTGFLHKRKSTGENFIGAWQAGTESPIGAGMYQLIKKLQSERGGKGNEYKNKFAKVYDYLEPAIKLAKQKKKKKRPHG